MRGIKFTGLNILLCVPTAMWIAQMEVWFPDRPFFQVCVPLYADGVCAPGRNPPPPSARLPPPL